MAKDIQDRELLEAILWELRETRGILDEYLVLRPQIKEIIADKDTSPERRERGQELLDKLDIGWRESKKSSIRDVPPDYENLRTMEEFRDGIDGEVKKLRAAGLSQRDIDLWLAGARWANRMDRILLKELERGH